MEEHETRVVPIAIEEVMWARKRPPEHRVPRPRPGDPVLYRHEEWEQRVHQARLIDYVELDDYTDPLMWQTVAAPGPLFATAATDPLGRRLVEPVEDPWPLALLDTPFGRLVTREARLRGSPGWLSLDWQARYRPVPSPLLVARHVLPAAPTRPQVPLPGSVPVAVPARSFVP